MPTLATSLAPAPAAAPRAPWLPDLGDGRYQNPVLFADYSDPDVVRVGDDYWLTSSSFSHVPGLPILHSHDLVNWELVSYALDRLDLGPEYRLEGGKEIYGKGIWAPSEARISSLMPCSMGVSKIPGAIVITRMPNFASSRAIGRVIPFTPAFEAA